MHTTTITTATATLLAACNEQKKLDQLLMQFGFTEPAHQLDELARESLGLPYGVCAARVARAEGGLRALLLTVTPETQPGEIVSKIATRFAERVPHLLWMVIVLQPETALITIAAWSAEKIPVRIAALVIDRNCIMESDAETVCALRACTATHGDVLRHTAWLEVLGRQAVIQRVYRTIERMTGTLADSLSPAAPSSDAQQLALLCISRLLFLSFVEAKGWLNNNCHFLANGLADCLAHGGRYHQRVLTPLFFGTLNTRPAARALRAHAFGKIPFLNGGLFSRTPLERQWRTATFSDDTLGTLYRELLQRYHFTPRVDPMVWSDAIVDPQILGHAFEAVIGSQKQRPIHSHSGSCYAAEAVVGRLVTLTLAEALCSETVSKDVVQLALAGELPSVEVRGVLLGQTAQLRILDLACGSGTFLISALEQIAALRARLGDVRPIAAIRRSVLMTSIHGVADDQMAIWLCKCRLWISTLIESEERNPALIMPLPCLDNQIRVGSASDGDVHVHKVAGAAGFNVILGNTPACTTTLKRSTELLLPNGTLGLLLPTKLWQSPTSAATRTFLQTHVRLLALEDLSQSASLLGAIRATADLSLLIAQPAHGCHAVSQLASIAVHRAGSSVKWHAPLSTLALDCSPGSPWLLVPPTVRAAFNNVAGAGVALQHSVIGPVRLHNADMSDTRVTWSDVGRSLHATVLQPSEPPLPSNTCHVIHSSTAQDAYACAALFSTPLAAAWLGIIAEPAQGGLRRHLGCNVGLLPIPRDWARAREILAPLGERIAHGELLAADKLHGATLQAYRLRADSVEPLLIWDIRSH